jgi:hypothetical protein
MWQICLIGGEKRPNHNMLLKFYNHIEAARNQLCNTLYNNPFSLGLDMQQKGIGPRLFQRTTLERYVKFTRSDKIR